MISGTAFEQMRLCTTVSPGWSLEDRLGDDRGRGRARDRLGLVVDEEHAVGVAVEREADVGAGVEHRLLEVLEVLGLDRVGRVVRERAVELARRGRSSVERQALEHRRDDEAAHAVGGVGHDPQRPQHATCRRSERTWSANSLEQVARARPGPASSARSTQARRDRLLDLDAARCPRRPARRRPGTA